MAALGSFILTPITPEPSPSFLTLALICFVHARSVSTAWQGEAPGAVCALVTRDATACVWTGALPVIRMAGRVADGGVAQALRTGPPWHTVDVSFHVADVVTTASDTILYTDYR